MKKLLLLLSLGVVVNGAYAQKASNTSIMVSPITKQNEAVGGKQVTAQEMKQLTAWKNLNSRAANKGTINRFFAIRLTFCSIYIIIQFPLTCFVRDVQ